MKIRHEVPKAELDRMVAAPLSLDVAGGKRVTVRQWSLDGFTYPDPVDVLPKEAVLTIPFQGIDITFPVTLERAPGTQFLRFVGLSGRHRETLAVFYRSLLSGRMASTEDIITSLDTPVDLVPMGETEEETSVATNGKTPRSLRAAFNVALYLCIALAVFWTLGQGIWSKLSTVQIENSRIEAVLRPHLSAEGGYVDKILVAAGDRVTAGEILVRVSDPERESALTEVRSRIKLLENRLDTAETRADDLSKRIEIAKQSLLQAITDGHATVADLDAFTGRYYAPNADLFVAESAVLNEIDALREELRRLRRERGTLRDATDAMHIIAQENGIVTELNLLKGQLVARGAVALTLEEHQKRQAVGWVNQSMASTLFTGMTVSVRANGPDGGRKLRGQITRLEAGINPDLTSEFGMLVFVDFPELTLHETRQSLPHLSPVTLTAQRRWARQAEDTFSALGQ